VSVEVTFEGVSWWWDWIWCQDVNRFPECDRYIKFALCRS